MTEIKALYRASENAGNLYKRTKVPCFEWSVPGGGGAGTGMGMTTRHEVFRFGDITEVLVQPKDMPDVVLDLIGKFIAYANKEQVAIIHVSIGKSLGWFLRHDSTGQSARLLHAQEESKMIKEAQVTNLLELLALLQMLRTSLQGQRSLVVFEGLSPLFTSQRGVDGSSLSEHSLVEAALHSLQRLGEAATTMSVWFSSDCQKGSGGNLREGSLRDPLSIMWRERMTRFFVVPSLHS